MQGGDRRNRSGQESVPESPQGDEERRAEHDPHEEGDLDQSAACGVDLVTGDRHDKGG